MTGYRVLLTKEWLETRRTWRIWVIPGLLLFFAVVSPLLAELTPSLVESFASDQPGTVIILPDPVPADAYRQFFGSLTQVVLIALVIVTADSVSGERRSGTAVLVLTKPTNRAAFLLAKVTAHGALFALALIVASLVCWAGTFLIFSEAPVRPLIEATGLFLLLGLVFITAMTLCSVEIRSQAGAAGAGIAFYAALLIAAQWRPLRDWSPAGLFSSIDDAISASVDTALAGPVLAACAAIALVLLVAVARFERTELTGTS